MMMVRNICIQLWNNKRSNGWLALELLLIFCFIWYLVDFFFVLGFNYSLKDYRDLDHTWKITVATYPEEHPSYQPGRAETGQMFEDYNRLLEVLENNPSIEAVGISYYNSGPGSSGRNSSGMLNPEDSTRRADGQELTFCPERDYLSVFRYSKANGTMPVNAREYDWSIPNGILINHLMERGLFANGVSAKGKSLGQQYGDREFRVLDVLDNTKRFASGRPQRVIFIPERLSEANFRRAEISIRAVSSLSDAQFKADFLENVAGRLQIGNYYFRNMTTYNNIHENTEKLFGLTTQISMRICMMVFFLINIVLCLIGTFWYRVSRRKEEIGIRMATGSTYSGIRRLFILEALILLVIVFFVSMLFEYQIVRLDLLDTYGEGSRLKSYIIFRPLLRFIVTNLISFFLIALVVIGAVWLPAQKAAEMEPADALHDE